VRNEDALRAGYHMDTELIDGEGRGEGTIE